MRNALNSNISCGNFQTSEFPTLNIPQHVFTVALWIQLGTNYSIFFRLVNSVSCLLILSLRSSHNILVSYLPNSTNKNIGVSLTGSKLIINQSTPIAFTWSHENQAQLYQDTAWQRNNNATKLGNGYENSMTVTLGMYCDKANYAGGDGIDSKNRFIDSLDEFYIV